MATQDSKILNAIAILFGIAIIIGIIWVLLSGIRYLWDHPLF